MKIKNFMQEQLNLLLFKNTIVMLIPAIIIFAVIFGITYHYPVIYQMTCHRIETLEEMQEWYGQKCYNVQLRMPQLKYTGYDYYEDGRQVASYYYAFVEDRCMFFLVKTKAPEAVLENELLRGKLLRDSAGLDAVKLEFSKELGLDYDAFDTLVNPIMVSEVDYPYLETILLWILIIIPYIITISIIILSVVWTIQPYRHPSTRQLSDFGDRKLVYEEIRSQLNNRLIKHNYNYYLTDEYLVISNWGTTDFIRIDYIRYISRHVILKWNGRKQVYRLTMSNPEKMFYENDFDSEACAEEIMVALIQLNPRIDNRTIKVFDLEEHPTSGEEPQRKEETAEGEKPTEERPVEEKMVEEQSIEENQIEESQIKESQIKEQSIEKRPMEEQAREGSSQEEASKEKT